MIYALAELDGIKRIRYTTSHPLDMHDELYNAHRDVPMLMPFLHLPVQSGSDLILNAMNRKHTAADYLKIIEKLRIACADIKFSSDFIVGYPGETNKDHKDTLELIKNVGYVVTVIYGKTMVWKPSFFGKITTSNGFYDSKR